MRRIPLVTLLGSFVGLAAVSGCVPKNETADGPTCKATTTDVAMDAATPIGVVPADVLTAVPAAEDTVFSYTDGTTSDLALTFTPGTTARFVDLEPDYPDTGETTAIGIICDDYVAIDADFTFTTADGVFAESLSGEIQATAEGMPGVGAQLDLAAMGGSFVIGDYTTTTGWDDASASVSVGFVGDGTTRGDVTGQVSGSDPCTDDPCTAWAENVPVGVWGASEG